MDDKPYFKSIILYTSHLSELHQFYILQLKFECLFKSKDRIDIKVGRSILTFLSSKINYRYHFAFNIPENTLDKSLAFVEGLTSIIPYENKSIVNFPNWNAHSLYFKDPVGNIVEFIARHNLKNATDREFSARSILELSEIGVTVTDLQKWYVLVQKWLNFDLFWGNLKNFAAIGHEKCLLISVPESRPWFPTEDVFSEINPMSIIIEFEKDTIELKEYRKEYVFTKV